MRCSKEKNVLIDGFRLYLSDREFFLSSFYPAMDDRRREALRNPKFYSRGSRINAWGHVRNTDEVIPDAATSIEDKEIESRELQSGVTVESRRELLISCSSMSSIQNNPSFNSSVNNTIDSVKGIVHHSKIRTILQNTLPEYFPPSHISGADTPANSLRMYSAHSAKSDATNRSGATVVFDTCHRIMAVAMTLIFLIFFTIIIVAILTLAFYIWFL